VRVPDDELVALGQRTVLLRPDAQRVDPAFLYYLLIGDEAQAEMRSRAEGSTLPHLNVAEVRSLRLPQVPPVDEQIAIASVLASLDDKIASNRRLAVTAEELADVIFAGFVGGHTPLERVASVTMGSSPPGSTYNEIGEGLPFYQGVADFGFRFPGVRVFCSAPVRVAGAGDVLLSVRAPVGRLNQALVECCIGRGVAALASEHPRSLLYALRSARHVWAPYNAEGTVFGAIKADDLKAVAVPWPADGSVGSCEAALAELDDRLSAALIEIDTLRSLRDALLPELLSGRLRVRDAESVVEGVV
jgi:type I restriction enzyme S subunit